MPHGPSTEKMQIAQLRETAHLQSLVFQIVEQLVERGYVGAHLNPEELQPVDRHQVDDDREPGHGTEKHKPFDNVAKVFQTAKNGGFDFSRSPKCLPT
jgi:hypothetical protein